MLRLCSILVLCAAASGVFAAPSSVSGPVRVVDGDTIEIAGHKVRLFGIDAVERDQTCRHPTRGEWPCGAEVARVLAGLIDGQAATCESRGVDRYGRMLGICRINGQDVGAALVEAGWAFAYKKYSTLYVREEQRALHAGRGLWTSVVVQPSQYRASKRAPVQVAPSGCPIKGNISADGKRIYHLPGQAFYSRTRISETKGERWFCTEYAARMAGWRRARQ
ncbi:thermonuclease family protein [Primorskyibacter aestuariivivens]|uniref:thermonuclease family protein n=1 Tax=Primorskyibacter aestuariivivens TaxID=1888912 RepID=UPI0023001719|nr:thermonuclease family protein [Primorskyibacter aestuariivivens]MDA7428522.1 thermonuclease family protein [Primorskyibacter aestuariivivens]